jgi:hypothetical protein
MDNKAQGVEQPALRLDHHVLHVHVLASAQLQVVESARVWEWEKNYC